MPANTTFEALENALIKSASHADRQQTASVLLDLIWHVAGQRGDMPNLPSSLAENNAAVSHSIVSADKPDFCRVNRAIITAAVLPHVTPADAKEISGRCAKLDSLPQKASLPTVLTSASQLWNSVLCANQRMGRVTLDLDLDDDNARTGASELNVGAHTGISFRRTLRVPEDGQEYPLPADMGTLPIYRIEDYADKVPPHWLNEGGFFIPLYQREALFVAFEGASWRPTVAKVAVGRINAITGKPYDERIRQHEQDYVIIPDQQWLDGINTGKNLVSQFVAMPLGKGYTIEEQMTDEAQHGGFQIVVFESKFGRFPEENPEEAEARATATAIRRLRPQLETLVLQLPSPYPAIAKDFLNRKHCLATHEGKTLSVEEQTHFLEVLRTFFQQKLGRAEIAGWADADIEEYSEKLSPILSLSAPIRLGSPEPVRFLSAGKRMVEIEMGIARGGSIKQQIYRDHYGVESWDESAKRMLNIRIVNSTVFQKITGMPPPESPVTIEAYQQCGIPWYHRYDETADSVAPAKKFSFVKSIVAIARLRGRGTQDDSPVVITPEVIRRIHTPTHKERIGNFLGRAEASWTAGQFAIAHREATLALALIEKGHWNDDDSQQKQRALTIRASCNNELNRFLEAEADATELLKRNGNTPVPLAIRANCYLRMLDWELAIEDATKAIKIDPLYLVAHEILAEALVWSDAMDSAFVAAERALKLNPTSRVALVVRGECWQRLGHPINAVTDFTQALTHNGPDAVTYGLRADSFVALGRVDDAKADLKSALKLNPTYNFARDLLARISS